MPRPLPRRIRWVRTSIASPPVLPSPLRWRVGIRIFTFEACSGFTHVAACWLAQPPKATFVTRLQCGQLPDHPARQLPDLSTAIWVDSSSTGDTRLSGHTAQSGITRTPPRISLRFIRATMAALRRHRFGKIFIIDLVLDRLEGREGLGRKRDRLAAAVGYRRGGTPGRFARQRIEVEPTRPPNWISSRSVQLAAIATASAWRWLRR